MAHRNWTIRLILICAIIALAVGSLKKSKRRNRQGYNLKDLKTSPQVYYGYSGYSIPQHPLLSLLYPQSHAESYLVYSPASYHSYESTSNALPGAPQIPSLPLPVPSLPAPDPPAPTPVPACRAPSPVCRKSVYRTYDGSCNNLIYPTWGMANTGYQRILRANYADGIHMPPVSKSGRQLPLARAVSSSLFPDVDIQDPKWTLVAMQWGQIMTHDMAMIDGSTQSKPHMTRCCTDEGRLIPEAIYSSPLCFPILIPRDDPVYNYQECRNFIRSTTDLDRGCTSGDEPAEQLTVVSHFLDLSLTYGSSDQVALGLRRGYGGLLESDYRNNREWLPEATNKSAACDVVDEREYCYRAGDARVNQNPQLTILQLYLHKEHNRIAYQLADLNPHWSDETIYQEARRINTAVYQYISYYEWLPIFIGEQNALKNKILYQTHGYVNDYNANENPSTINEHSTAAFRYFHSLIAGKLLLVNEYRYNYSYEALRLSDHYNRPGIIEVPEYMEKLTRGMSFQPQENSDQYFDSEITKYLFRNMQRFGDDLRAFDVQRNRDHGLAPYNDYRVFAGLPKAVYWEDFGDVISAENIQRLAQLYESPDDVDLTIGGSLERHVPGTLVGPTFLYILTQQFYKTRVGDRYWFETGDPELAFTVEQLAEIRKGSIARLFCDNADDVKSMQLRAFERVSDSNPVVDCSYIPFVDLRLWKDIRVPEVVSNYFGK